MDLFLYGNGLRHERVKRYDWDIHASQDGKIVECETEKIQSLL